MTILLIDDDEDFRRGLAENLRDDGHLVREYAAPAEVPLAEVLGVDLAITDYLMTGENGLDFAQRLHASYPNIPVVLLTAFSTRDVEREAATSGFISLLHKPVAYERLHHLLRSLLPAS